MAGIFTSTSPLYMDYLKKYNEERSKGNTLVKLTPQQFLGYYGSETRALNKILTKGNPLQAFVMQAQINKLGSKQALLVDRVLYASSYDKYRFMSQDARGVAAQHAVGDILQQLQPTQSEIDKFGLQNTIDKVQKNLTNPDMIKRHLEILSPDEWLEYRMHGLSNKEIIENEYDISNSSITAITKAVKEIVNTKGSVVYKDTYDISNLESHLVRILNDPNITSLDDLVKDPEKFLVYLGRLNRGMVTALTKDQFRGLIGLLKNMGLPSTVIDEILSPGAN